MKNDVNYVHSLVLSVRRSGDVGELENFFGGGEYRRYRVSRIVDCLLDDIFTLEELVGHQLTIVVLEVSQHIRNNVVDIIGSTVVDICEVRFLDRGHNILHESLLHSRKFLERTHFIGVCNPNAEIFVCGCAVRDDDLTHVSRADKGSGKYERLLRIGEPYAEVTMCPSSEIGVDVLVVCLDLV